jgi:hypothetical protein
MTRLNIEPNKKAHRTVNGSSTQGNIRAIILWVNKATADDAKTLQVLHAVTKVKMALGGH